MKAKTEFTGLAHHGFDSRKVLPFEILIFFIAFLSVIILPIILKGGYFQPNWNIRDAGINGWDIILIFGSSLGFTGIILLTNKNKWAWLFVMAHSFVHGVYAWYLGTYALSIIDVTIIPALMILQYFLWKKQIAEGEVTVVTRKLGLKQGLTIITGVLLLAFIIAPIVISIDRTASWGSWLSWVDAILAALTIFGYILSVMRFRETWYVWLIFDSLSVISWSILVGQSDLSYVEALTVSTAYLTNTIYSLIFWKRSKLVDVKEIVKS